MGILDIILWNIIHRDGRGYKVSWHYDDYMVRAINSTAFSYQVKEKAAP